MSSENVLTIGGEVNRIDFGSACKNSFKAPWSGLDEEECQRYE